MPAGSCQFAEVVRAFRAEMAAAVEEETARLRDAIDHLAAEAERLFQRLEPLREEGVAILLVSHRLGDLRR